MCDGLRVGPDAAFASAVEDNGVVIAADQLAHFLGRSVLEPRDIPL